MKALPTTLPGLVELRPDVHEDKRGLFVKVFQESVYADLGLETRFREVFYSRSSRGVVRGLHFQAPPRAQTKLAYCVWGEVFDVAVDIRTGSPTYGSFEVFRLDATAWTALLMPPGFAHGFAALSDEAVMAYAVSEEHDPDLDTGVRWDSVAIPWPFADPIVSDRDAALPALLGLESPFTWEGGG